jgi:hypothetical protein
MKYSIHINQLALVSIAPSLDIIDATVLDWALAYIVSGNAEKITLNHETYHWLSYSACMKDLPLLHVSSKQSIRRRFKNLTDARLLEIYPNNQLQGRTYFKAGILAAALYFEGSSLPDPISNLIHYTNTIDSNIKDSKELEQSSRSFDFSYLPENLLPSALKEDKAATYRK